jgi:DNA replication and repair protein RecF
MFLPQDMQIVTGSPAKRRRYMDITLCQVDPVYCRTLSAYNKVLEQRNALLRRIVEQGNGRDLLPIYTDRLLELGSQIFLKRANFIASLGRKAHRIHYEALTDGTETLRIRYLPRLSAASTNKANNHAFQESSEIADWIEQQSNEESVSQKFRQALDQAQASELARGSTRVGPHRDDWRFWVNSRELSSYGSRGQQRSAILALKLAEVRWMVEQTGETPILLLDEVVAELDEQRRALLLETVREASQAILTATDPGMFTEEFLKSATTMTVASGRVTPDL